MMKDIPIFPMAGGVRVSEALQRPGTSGPLALLAPLAFLVAGYMALRRRAYRAGLLPRSTPSIPVVSIGNLTVGGVGKTPLVAFLAEQLDGDGHRVAILTRGYGGAQDPEPRILSVDRLRWAAAAEVGDEPLMLCWRLPRALVVVSPDRARGCRAAVAAGATMALLDDGFQHLRLRRHADIVVMDPARPFGNGRCLPAGALREGPGALADAGAVVCVAKQGGPVLFSGPHARLLPRRQYATALRARRVRADGEVVPPQRIAGARVIAFCGIGNPHGFARTLETLGCDVAELLAFPDHHPYRDGELDEIARRRRKQGASLVLTTEKDLARIEPRTARIEGLAGVECDLQFMEGHAGDLTDWVRSIVRT